MIPYVQQKADSTSALAGILGVAFCPHISTLLGVCHQHSYILKDSAFLFTVDCEIWITVLSASLCLQQAEILTST